jgi:hypothetical protein
MPGGINEFVEGITRGCTGDSKKSQIQAGSKHNVPLDHLNPFTELVLQVCVANVLCSLTQLPKNLL